MSASIYKWTRKHYSRNTPSSKWTEIVDAEQTIYITESWRDEKTSKQEARWFRAIGAWVRVSHNPYTDITTFTNISPDKLEKSEETFVPVRLTGEAASMGWRERDAFFCAYDEDQRIYNIVENTPDHVIIEIGADDRRALLDVAQMR